MSRVLRALACPHVLGDSSVTRIPGIRTFALPDLIALAESGKETPVRWLLLVGLALLAYVLFCSPKGSSKQSLDGPTRAATPGGIPVSEPKRVTRQKAHVPKPKQFLSSLNNDRRPDIQYVRPGGPLAEDVKGAPLLGPFPRSLAEARKWGMNPDMAGASEAMLDRELALLEKLETCTAGKLKHPGELLVFLTYTTNEGPSSQSSVGVPAKVEPNSSSFDEGDDDLVLVCLEKAHADLGPIALKQRPDGGTFYQGSTIRLPRGYDSVYAWLKGML